MNWPRQLLFSLPLLILVWGGCSRPAFQDVYQPHSETFLTPDPPLEQTFIAHHAGLSYIDLMLAPTDDASERSVTVHLRLASPGRTHLTSVTLSGPSLAAPGWQRFSFPAVRTTHSQRYLLLVEGTGIQIGISPQDLVPDGSLSRGNQPSQGDIALRLGYSRRLIVLDLLRYGLRLGGYGVAAVFLFILPGLGVLTWLPQHLALRWPQHFGLAIGISLSVYPLLLLGMRVIGVSGIALVTWLPGLLGCGLLFIQLYRGRSRISLRRVRTEGLRSLLSPSAEWPADALLLITVLGIVGSRLLPIRSLPAPSWGDSVHHTLIARLIYENGGLFSSWEPYTAIHSFTYHFGFHAAVAAWMGLTRMPGPEATLLCGQVLNVLAVCALYPLATRLTGGHSWAGVAALLVAGLLTQMPGFYLNWGRYTQLAGQAILPALLWTFDVLWLEQKRPPRWFVLLMAVLAAGLALTHYRVAIVAGVAGFSWLLWSFWKQRTVLADWWVRTGWIVIACALAGLLILPWGLTVRSGRLAATMSWVANRPLDAAAVRGELAVWQQTSEYYPHILWVGAIAALLLALWWRKNLAVPLVVWGVGCFIVTNPFYVRLPGTGVLSNFALFLGLYIPLSLIWGWLVSMGIKWVTSNKAIGQWALVALLLIFIATGTHRQFATVNPFFQMVTAADLAVFQWVEQNVSQDSLFAVNGFLAFSDTTVVGSDAGWWLPQYTLRASMLPPILYGVEQSGYDAQALRQFEIDIRSSGGAAELLFPPLCAVDVTHIFLGQRRGTVGYDPPPPLFPEDWLQENPAFTLLYQQEKAQIWQFDRSQCPT